MPVTPHVKIWPYFMASPTCIHDHGSQQRHQPPRETTDHHRALCACAFMPESQPGKATLQQLIFQRFFQQWLKGLSSLIAKRVCLFDTQGNKIQAGWAYLSHSSKCLQNVCSYWFPGWQYQTYCSVGCIIAWLATWHTFYSTVLFLAMNKATRRTKGWLYPQTNQHRIFCYSKAPHPSALYTIGGGNLLLCNMWRPC